VLLQKDSYESFYPYVDIQHLKDNWKELYHLYKAVESLRSEYPDKDFDLNGLQTYFFYKYPDADKDIYLNLFKTLAEVPIDPELGLGILKQIKKRKMALQLSEQAFKYATGAENADAIFELTQSLQDERETSLEDIEVVSDDLEFLLNETVQKPGLRWRLNCLNRSLGSLRKSNFGFLFARPETGKTTFLASECSFMLTQLNDASGPIVWFNNEQAGNEVMLRIYQAFFGVTLAQLLANPKKYKKEFQEQTKGRFKLVDDANVDRVRVEKVCKQLSPSLVVFDQIDKVKGFAADREDLRLGAIYIWARELAKQYCPVIGVCQADGSAENQKWLTMENVSNAKTSKQAEADWILGIGKTYSDGYENVRFLNISKNKLLGDEDSIPDLRHGKFETLMQQETARYEDMVEYA
jgi:replicative DNA helicase